MFYTSVPFPLFPSLYSLPAFPFPRSLPEAVSGVCDLYKSPSFQVCAFPPLLFPSHCSLPSFPIDDYVPALFPYWRLCSRPLSLFSIMFLLPFLIFDYAPDTLCPWCPYVTFTRLLKVQFYVLSIWVSRPDNYYLCTKLCMFQNSHIIFNAEEPSLNNECSSPLK